MHMQRKQARRAPRRRQGELLCSPGVHVGCPKAEDARIIKNIACSSMLFSVQAASVPQIRAVPSRDRTLPAAAEQRREYWSIKNKYRTVALRSQALVFSLTLSVLYLDTVGPKVWARTKAQAL
jgi:hypothetical protein